MLSLRSVYKQATSIASRPQIKSAFPRTSTRKMHIQSIPMSVGQSNNYAYIVSDDSKTESVIFDPAFPDDVAPTLKPQIENINLTKIINTHHHWDHSHGNDEVRTWFSSQKPKIFGGKDCQSVDYTPAHKESFEIGKGIKVTALHTPCHTQDSICWYLEDSSDRAVFTGDTLFIGGCGRMFEGTAPEMHKALNEVLSALPDDTKVYPGHEYTKANVKFPKKILGDSNGQIADKETNRLDQLASNNEQTQGKSTIGDEKKYNIFMRVADPEIQKLTGQSAPADVLGALRLAKDKDGGNVSKDDLIGIMKNYKGAGAQKDEL